MTTLSNTVSISGHKFLGTAICGIVLTSKSFLHHVFACENTAVECVRGIQDITFSGCRSGLNILMLHNTLCSIEVNTEEKNILKNLIHVSLQKAKKLQENLEEIVGKDQVYRSENGFNIVFPRPKDETIRKYCLMPILAGKVSACILPNVDDALIQQFLEEYKIQMLAGYKNEQTCGEGRKRPKYE